MVTVEELIASTQLDGESQERLQKVLMQIGYRGRDEVDDIMRGLREEDLDKEAALAKLIPPLTLRERRALLQKIRPEGELILTVRMAPCLVGRCLRCVVHILSLAAGSWGWILGQRALPILCRLSR